jgi:hypothetical protein
MSEHRTVINKHTARLLKWLQKGQHPEDEGRANIEQIYFGEKSITATNGFEMRSSEIPPMMQLHEKGGYTFRYPIYLGSQIIETWSAKEDFHQGAGNVLPTKNHQAEIIINPEWLRDILAGMKDAIAIRVHEKSIEIFGKIGNENVYAILMQKHSFTSGDPFDYFSPRGDLPTKETPDK